MVCTGKPTKWMAFVKRSLTGEAAQSTRTCSKRNQCKVTTRAVLKLMARPLHTARVGFTTLFAKPGKLPNLWQFMPCASMYLRARKTAGNRSEEEAGSRLLQHYWTEEFALGFVEHPAEALQFVSADMDNFAPNFDPTGGDSPGI